MTREEAISYIENYTWSTTKLGLSRTLELLERIGNPQKTLRFVHVAGSNGKGSTCAMLDSVLRAAGYRTGLYTSPYIEDFCERMRVNGENISGDKLASITDRVRYAADAMEDHPSQFELVTAIAMEYFRDEKCDIVVLEVGMGGELDSTNAIDAPEAAVIMNIGLEHTEYLGSTLAEIASAKAGIIKTGCSCVCYDSPEEAKEVVRKVCCEKQVPLTEADASAIVPESESLEGQIFSWKDMKHIELKLIGSYQMKNAAVVLETVEVLRQRGWNISKEAVRKGLKTVNWPARFEVLGRSPLFILDGGHNPQCAEALTESIRKFLPEKKPVFLIGMLADKNYNAVLDTVLPLAGECVCLTPFSDRALPAEELCRVITEKGGKAKVCKNVSEGIKEALDAAGKDGQVVSFGSLYLAGHVRSAFQNNYKKWLRSSCICARDAMTEEERIEKSDKIIQNIMASDFFCNAKTIMVYCSTRGEVKLERIEEAALKEGKTFVYPLCLSNTEMKAYLPQGPNAWKSGYMGIMEPVPEKSEEIAPKDIDLVICPGAAFDKKGNRIGMGGGFYDRFLPKCVNAHVVGAAFEVQIIDDVPVFEHDRTMEEVFTERL